MFGKRTSFICPRCLRDIKLPQKDANRDYPCPQCTYVIPISYIRAYPTEPPLFAQVFGLSQHGKTLFLDVLKLHLIHYIYPHWLNLNPSYGHQPLTQADVDKERYLMQDIERGRLPGATQRVDSKQNTVYITRHFNMPRWGNRTSVIMDYPGEFFDSMTPPVEELPVLVKSPTTFMIISLDDLLNSNTGDTMSHLLNFYISAMDASKVDMTRQRRKLVFVFTKADKLTHLPLTLQRYLAEDPILTPTPYLSGPNLLTYLERMYRVSNEIQSWLQSDPTNQRLGSLPMLSLIQNKNIEARYTLISALGQDISTDHDAAVYIKPKRILDPFFWALEFQSREQ